MGDQGSNLGTVKLDKRLSAAEPSVLLNVHYVPTIHKGQECQTRADLWLSNSGQGFDSLVGVIPSTEEIYKAYGSKDLSKKSIQQYEGQLNALLKKSHSGGKSSASKSCSSLVSNILNIRLVTATSHFLKVNLKVLDGAALEAKKNMELGSRFQVAINQSLNNAANESCDTVNKLKAEYETSLKTYVKECFNSIYGEGNWTESASIDFACENFNTQACEMMRRIYQ